MGGSDGRLKVCEGVVMDVRGVVMDGGSDGCMKVCGG